MKNEEFSNDNIIASILTECQYIMKGCDTQTKMTVCYNLTQGILRLFTVQMSKDDVNEFIDEFSKELKESINEMYQDTD